ncbi:sphingomyelin phosphodiesterase [Capsaspora owczarzaki ATCC 30864]|nr:sphingomyelin phosphodiesterase [Capsaspora owczarzaki ATCC 30864]|eukprot:XP_004366050.2 sphingomyelin phosphodiesterase [Capsaspora owczarzaki ATCC 30864]
MMMMVATTAAPPPLRRSRPSLPLLAVALALLLAMAFAQPAPASAAPMLPVRHYDRDAAAAAAAAGSKLSPTAALRLSLKDISLRCDGCKALFLAFDAGFKANLTTDAIVKIAIDICVDFKIEDYNVCSLIVPLFAPEVLGVISRTVLGPEEACVTIGECTGDVPYPWLTWNVTLPNIPKPPTPIPPTPPSPSSPRRRVLHVSDLHIDLEYTPGLDTQCGEPLCCRPPNKVGVYPNIAGLWGDYQCDMPYRTVEAMFRSIAQSSPKIDYVFMTGDIPAHNVWNQSRDDQLTSLHTACNLMRTTLPGITVYPTVGNHESSPVNSFPPPYIKGEQSNQWLLDAFATEWATWLPASTMDTIRYGGYYQVEIEPGLRLASLNMNFCNNGNYWLFVNETDPAGQLQWLINVLQTAETANEKVYIIGHIAPGSCTKTYSFNYYKIVDRYESTIAGQFFGHSHHDEFEIFFDEATLSRSTGMVYIGGSVTTYTGINPNYRIYDVDGGSTKAVVDSYTYYLNLTQANLNGSSDPVWQFEYSARDAYNMTNLFGPDWYDFVLRMNTDNNLLNLYNYYNVKSAYQPSCDDNCKASTLCSLVQARPDSSLCKNVTPADMLSHRRSRERC